MRPYQFNISKLFPNAEFGEDQTNSIYCVDSKDELAIDIDGHYTIGELEYLIGVLKDAQKIYDLNKII